MAHEFFSSKGTQEKKRPSSADRKHKNDNLTIFHGQLIPVHLGVKL